jgi:hypothetical protein
MNPRIGFNETVLNNQGHPDLIDEIASNLSIA